MNTTEVNQQVQISAQFRERDFKSLFFFWYKRGDRRAKAIERYRKFLKLVQKYPEQKLVPTKDIDHCWHIHIEQSFSYQIDCMKNFGKLIKHNAGFGREASERTEWRNLFNKTSDLWRLEYNEPYKDYFFNTAQYCTRE